MEYEFCVGYIAVESDFINLWMVRRGEPVKGEFVPPYTDSIATAYILFLQTEQVDECVNMKCLAAMWSSPCYYN